MGGFAPGYCVNTVALTHSPGIYFNFMGNTEVYQTHWTLLVHYHLENYFYELGTLSDCIGQVELLCKKLHGIQAKTEDCYIMYNQLLLQLEEINNTQESLLHSSRRSKRS